MKEFCHKEYIVEIYVLQDMVFIELKQDIGIGRL
jgi:hypothetical protein